MTGIESWSTTAASNNAATPNGWPEGQAPSTVNDCARQNMASIRTWYQDCEWVPWGDTCAYVSSTSFKIAGSDVTTRYTVGRRVRAVGSSTGTIYGKIITSAFSTDTTVTLVWDTGSLSNETLTVSLSAIKGSASGAAATAAHSVDFDAISVHGADVASATTIVLNNTTGDVIDVTGTTTITTITLAEGRQRTVRFTGILTLTNGSNIVLPGAANITTAAGDYAIFRGYASSVVRCVAYSKADGTPVAGSTTAFTDSTFTVGDDGDSTKKLAFQCSGITTATTRTLTVPDASGTILLSYTTFTNALSGDVSLNNTANYFDGPSIAQGTSGTWLVIGTVTLTDTSTANYNIKLWDGTTVFASCSTGSPSTANNSINSATLMAIVASPAANLRISVKDTTSTSGKILFNQSGNSKDSQIQAFRIA